MATAILSPTQSFCGHSHPSHSSSMKLPSIFRKHSSKKEVKMPSVPSNPHSTQSSTFRILSRDPIANSRQRTMSNQTPFSQPTRRPKPVDHAPPPAYSPPSNSAIVSGPMQTTSDSPYAFLTQFDTVFLIDDSGSMAGRSWRETAAALSAITPICTAYDSDGIDIYFLNHRNSLGGSSIGGYTNITTTAGVENIFNTVRPLGGTPTATRLNHILKPYLAQVEESVERQAHGHDVPVKPLNIIVITDGVASDDVESVIVQAAKKLDAWDAEPWQVGIQFFQVGREPDAAEDLRDLDDALAGEHGIRDMVDTVPWSGEDGQVLTADGILKVVLGAVNKKLDRRRGSDERLRR